MAVTAVRSEKPYEKHAWILLFALGIIGLIVDSIRVIWVGWFSGPFPDPQTLKNLMGMNWDELIAASPCTVNLIRMIFRGYGDIFLGWAIFVMAVAFFPYRRGERWA